MTDTVLHGILEDIYAAFGKNAPSFASRQFENVQRRTAHIPDEVALDIRGMLEESADMPKNIGLALQNAWDSWLKAHPERKAHEQRFCGNCHNGYRIFHSDAQPFGSFIRCSCNGGDFRRIETLRQSLTEIRPHDLPAVVQARLNGWLAVHPDADDGCFRHFGPAQAIGVNTMPKPKPEEETFPFYAGEGTHA